MEEKSKYAFARIRRLVVEGTLKRGDKIDVQIIAADLRMSSAPVREALIRLSERQYVNGGGRQAFHVAAPGHAEQLVSLSLVRELMGRAIESIWRSEDALLISKALKSAVEAGYRRTNPIIFCYDFADAIGRQGLSQSEYLLYSIVVDKLTLIRADDAQRVCARLITIIVQLTNQIGEKDGTALSDTLDELTGLVTAAIDLSHSIDIAGQMVDPPGSGP